ncbi:MAG: radical SAM protein [Firmicutes bacterium]|nr:radical SAM protein [Bacillota bacterium]
MKIAEGCSNKCTYCAIPYIRGPYISRKMEDILAEAEKLAKDGIQEIIVIAQDTTKYGTDIYGKPMLAELLEKLHKIDGFKWIRFLYAYPEGITDKLIDTVKKNEKICNYFDIPIQHISNKILKLMNRNVPDEYIKNLINKIRTQIPDVIIRTSLIAGFPGEDEKDFQMLYDFAKETKFDKLRCFHIFKGRRHSCS